MSRIRSADEIYKVVETALAENNDPQTCAALMERKDVRDAALARFGNDLQIATNKLSDLLGFMWRRGTITRYPAPPNSTSMARYAYGAIKRDETTRPVVPIPPPTRSTGVTKPKFVITESDSEVTIDFEHVTLVIRTK